MSYLALYRKYRPKIFRDVVGQNHIVKTLQNQIKSDRIAHAYLFSGSRGTGKTSVAKIFARAVNCETPIDGSACMACETCQKMNTGVSMNVIEIDAASHNGVDNIREINEEVKYRPPIGKYKVYIIDEVHMLSIGAFNALLKTLEEPPDHIIFILATTDPQKIPVTILSRCQRFDFKRIQSKEIKETLIGYMTKEEISITEDAVSYIARLAEGGMRDALSVLEQCISFYYNEEITLDKVLYLVGAVDYHYLFSMMGAISRHHCKDAIEICDIVNMQGRSIRQFTNDLLVHTRNLLVAKTTQDSAGVLDYTKEYIEELNKQAKAMEVDALMRYIKVFSELDIELKVSSNPKVSLEVALLKLCEASLDTSKEAQADKIILLEQKLEQILSGQVDVKIGTSAKELVPLEQKVQPVPITKLGVAVPEDIKQVIEQWKTIIAQAGIGTKVVFETATPVNLGDDVLYIQYATGMEHSVNKYLDKLKQAIGDVTEKSIKVIPVSKKELQSKAAEMQGGRQSEKEQPASGNTPIDDIQAKFNINIKTIN